MKTNPSSECRSIFARTVKYGSIALAVVLAAGCVSINRLREAQDAFTQAAAAENAARFDTKPSDAIAGLGTVNSGYAAALLSLDKLESKDEAQLRKDGLWGTALTLKALTQWRLGQFDKARETATDASEITGDQLYPRDRAVIAALPGLIKTDQAYNKILANAPFADVQDLLIGTSGAVADVDKARGQVEKDHPVQVYLLQAQLAAYRNFQVALDRLSNHATVDAAHPARINANVQLKVLDQLLKAQKAGDAGNKLVEYWVELCTLERP